MHTRLDGPTMHFGAGWTLSLRKIILWLGAQIKSAQICCEASCPLSALHIPFILLSLKEVFCDD